MAAGAALPVAALIVFSLLPGDSSAPAGKVERRREAIVAFEKTLQPLIDDGAATVVYGMRPGMGDIVQKRFPQETLLTMAKGWERATTRIRDSFGKVAVPRFLHETAALYDGAFEAYAETAKALRAAVKARGDKRAALLVTAAEHGNRADDLFDRAEDELRQVRARLGMAEGT